MDFFDVIESRRSVRNYKSDEVSDELLQKLGHAVELAPSGCNRQPYKFLLIKNDKIKAGICEACPQRMLPGAPVLVAALGDMAHAWKRQDGRTVLDIDLGIAMEHLVLAARAEGLDSCWVCGYDQEKVDKAVGVEAPWTVVALAPLGYANITPGPLSRKKLNEIFEIVK